MNKIAKNKTIAIATVILLALSMSASMMLAPTVSAHTPAWQVPTYAYINVAPNPIGVGQQVTIVFWLDKVPIGAEGAWGSRWHNMKITVTHPDGTNATVGTYNSDSNGGASTRYTPTVVGNYTFYFEFPGQVAQNENPYPYVGFIGLGLDYVNDTFTASSAKTTLTVQQEPIQSAYPANPLPSQYWTRPINSMNREWAPIAGNWLGLGATSFGVTGLYTDTGGVTSSGGNFDPYSTAPNSAHVMWTQPIAFGGQIGGEFGSSDIGLYATGTAYEAKFGAVIINSILYYTEYPGAGTNPTGLKAVNLRTGATVWDKNITDPLRCGMIINFVTGDQYGAHAYLFTTNSWEGFAIPYSALAAPTTWKMYDAMTGNWILNIAGVQASDTLVEGPNGEILCYYTNSSAAGTSLSMWNSTLCISQGSQANLFYAVYSSKEIWRPVTGVTIPWSAGIQWSVPIATDIKGVPLAPLSLSVTGVDSETVLATASSGGIFGGPPGGASLGYRIEAGYSAVDGHLLWGPVNRTVTPFTTQVLSAGEGKYAEYTQQSMTWTCYDLKSGQKLWGPTEPVNSSWAYYDFTGPSTFGYGNFYTWGLGGTVYCYNATTGTLKWTWYAGNAGVDNPYGTWPLGTWSCHHILADGKLYVRAGHDYTAPVFKGAKLYCINATTGKEIWSSLSFDIVSSPALADGYMVWDNGYDNQIYCYGKGPSATTATAPQAGVELGRSLVISGTVLDVSAGTQQEAVKANFPYGVAAVSDASQSAWMEYLYQQQPMPTSATGVPVSIDVLDSNGNYRNIGTATTDLSGTFRFTWKPDIPGNYTVVATFPGSESYYPSYAETGFVVDPAAPTPSPPQYPVPIDYTMSIIGATVVLLIAIAIVGILLLRKK
jgi:outer membrane protein assembly factor BamB